MIGPGAAHLAQAEAAAGVGDPFVHGREEGGAIDVARAGGRAEDPARGGDRRAEAVEATVPLTE